MNEQNRKTILNHIDKIEQYAKTDPWLMSELRRRFGGENDYSIAQDIKEIRAALQIRGQNSISYAFIANTVLRNQLLVDNLRMENYALNLETIDETERFYYFCVNAFYQVENLLNYYFYVRYSGIDSLLTHLEDATSKSQYPFTRSGKEKTVGDVVVNTKLFVFCSDCFPFDKNSPDYTYKILNQLKNVRNEGLHRCDVIKKNQKEDLYNFFKNQDFNTIRTLLKKVAAKIEDELSKPKQYEATITKVLPSAIRLKFNGSETAIISIAKGKYQENDTIVIERSPQGVVKIIDNK